MSHLDYALAHTDWHAERQAGDGDAISRWTPYDKPVVSAQKELSKLPVYQRVYQSLKTRALGVLPADLNLRDQVGPTFDQVFTSADDNKLVVPQFLTRYGLQSYFVKQRDELVELTAMDSWVSATHRVAPLPAGNPERACTREIGAESRAVTA